LEVRSPAVEIAWQTSVAPLKACPTSALLISFSFQWKVIRSLHPLTGDWHR
ncbi:uncharacterized protein METZ01_LOCUS272810, partial [marine metagenome]